MSDATACPVPLPPGPKDGDRLSAHQANPQTLELLNLRRSTVAKDLKEPGPTDKQLGQLLRLASRVPDHGKLGPWRFLIFQGEARADFGKHLERIYRANEPAADQTRIDFERDRFMRAPTVVAVISCTQMHPKAPEWEQILSAGAACQNLLIGASAMGFAAQWLTEWYAYDSEVETVLGLTEGERVAGFIYLGSTDCQPTERRRPPLEPRVRNWKG